MAGEMNQSEVTRENFPMHFAIADEFEGEVHAFDQYQGPYVLSEGNKFWIVSNDDDTISIYNDRNEKVSEGFWPWWKDDETSNILAVGGAWSVSTIPPPVPA
jgi:hypothetical protein